MANSARTKIYLHHWEEGFSGLVIFLVIPAIVLLGAIFYWYRPTYVQNNLTTAQVLSTPTPSPWKTYSNDQYGFEITYPAEGVVLSEDRMQLGECGNAIKLDTNKSYGNSLQVDNFFWIKIVNWDKSISDYMKEEGAVGKYNVKLISGSGADEAIALEGLKKNVEYARGFPPLVYVSSLYKKNDNLFLLQSFPNPTNQGGCISPYTANPTEFPNIAGKDWDVATSLKFISKTTQLANPASVNCTEKGGTLTMAKRGDGKYGICKFADNKQCEEWALFRDDCPVGGVKVTGYDTPQQIYCAITGGSTTVEPGAVCKYQDGTSCDVDDLYIGRCQKGI